MEKKTKIHAEDDRLDLVITREFDLPVELLFKAHTESEIVAQWMGTKVLKLESKKYGGWAYETSDPNGNVVFKANGVFHDFVPNEKIVRTFEMDNVNFAPQLEFLEFEKLTDDTSKLTMQIIYKSIEHRMTQLKLPFAQGLNMAHNRLEEIVTKLKYKS
ncbi:MAG: SRPBCC domain-containing protein [Flavobacterium nitrogenifigens]|uniref:SRPBCC domain-containing protein n=1 Tax=Flavobacterium nitrogenifigens TaxID=1617283 RepID=UPI00280A26C2|nr:SRPBCC domain-containing protein [Flavobacterium nitrogenifigens]MDQ8013300.1 SRPBCC domain-containing protein [Flavobacterium nitrogenifigens]